MANDNSHFNSDGAYNNDHQYGFLRAMALNVLGLLPGQSGAPATSLAPGRAAAASSVPVVLSNEDLRHIRPNANARLLSSAASDNATLVSASARAVHKVSGLKATAANAWLKLYDKATAPTSGDTPIATLVLPASAAFELDMKGLTLVNGLGFRLVTGSADNDAVAVAAGDILGLNISYAT